MSPGRRPGVELVQDPADDISAENVDRPRADRLRDRGRPRGVRVHRRLGRREQPDLVRRRPARHRVLAAQRPDDREAGLRRRAGRRSCRTAGSSCSRRGVELSTSLALCPALAGAGGGPGLPGAPELSLRSGSRSGRRPGDRGPGRAARPRGVRRRRRGVPGDHAGRGLRDDAGQRTAGRDGRRQGTRLARPPRRGARGRAWSSPSSTPGSAPRPASTWSSSRPWCPACSASTTTAPRWPA